MNPTQQPPTSDTSTAPRTPAEVLRGAAAYLQRYGWIKGALYQEKHDQQSPPACAAGAIRVAVCGRPLDWYNAHEATEQQKRRIAAAEKVLLDHLGHDVDDQDDGEDRSPAWVIGRWNDADWNTANQVAAELYEAADDWDHDHRCEGHESLAGEHMGQTVYCDGTCRDGAQ